MTRKSSIFARLEHEHSPEAIARRLSAAPRQSYLRDWVYGAIDGSVTTFAVVSGVAGAGLDRWTILVLGAANLLADGFSMAAGNFLATRAENEERQFIDAYERRQIRVNPEGEREEVSQALSKQGFVEPELSLAVNRICAEPERWIRFMLTEEYGLSLSARSEWKAAGSTFGAFSAAGLVPLIPFLLGLESAFGLSLLGTFVTFFAVGSFRSRWSLSSPWKAGSATLAVGALSSLLAYLVGLLLGSFRSV